MSRNGRRAPPQRPPRVLSTHRISPDSAAQTNGKEAQQDEHQMNLNLQENKEENNQEDKLDLTLSFSISSPTEKSPREITSPRDATSPREFAMSSSHMERLTQNPRLSFHRGTSSIEVSPFLKDTKSECFQWGGDFKILEKPRVLRGKTIKKVKCGGSHVVALLVTGQVYIWGEGRCGQLGFGQTVKEIQQPKLLELEEPAEAIYAGLTQTGILLKSNKLLLFGVLGNYMEYTPKHIPFFDRIKIYDMTFGPSCYGTNQK